MAKNKPVITSHSNSEWRIPLEEILKTVLSSVAFHVYDQNKMNEIIEKVQQELEQTHGVEVRLSVQFNRPTLYVINDSF